MKTRPFVLLVVIIQVYGQLHYAAEECDSDDFLQLDGANFSLGNLGSVGSREEDTGGDGMLILIPNMSFTCSGSVTAWSGLISVVVTGSADDTTQFFLTIHFQVWRPASSDGTFDLIGSQPLVFDSAAISKSSVLTTAPWEDDENEHTYYHQFTGKTSMEDSYGSGIPVQPGDIVGCFIPAANHIAVVSLGLAFNNESIGGGRRMDLMVYPIEGDVCEAFTCGSQLLKTLSVWPLLQPQYATFTDEFGSGSGYFSTCSNLTTDGPSCSPKEDEWAIPGLLAVIAAACVAVVCLVGVATNTVTFCIARRKFKQQSYSPNNLHKQLHCSNVDRLMNCPFVVNHLVEEEIEEPPVEHSLLNLEEYFDYINETDTDSNHMSWV